MVKVMVNDQEVAYDRSGKGRCILLLHGWGASKENFSEIYHDLAGSFEVVTIDLPGFGESPAPSSDWTVGTYAELLPAFFKSIGIEEIYAVIGHSFGARVAIKALSQQLLKPEKVVLIGAAGIKHSNTVRNTLFRIAAKIGKTILKLPILSRYAESSRKRLYDAAGSTDYLRSDETMKIIFQATIQEDLSGDAKLIEQPTLLIWGSEDQEAPLADARYFHSVMPNSQLKIVQEAGHFVHNEKSGKTIRWIKSFLGLLSSASFIRRDLL
jgi:pimeloyl-ACP methyl ester carboxylesterase